MPKPFILNLDAKVAHRRPTREECNVDQVRRKRNADNVPAGYRQCEHCFTTDEREQPS